MVLGMECYGFVWMYELLWICMDFWTFLGILVCSISRV